MPFDLTINSLPSLMNIQASLSITLCMSLDLISVLVLVITESGHTIIRDQTKPAYVTRWSEYTLLNQMGNIIAKTKNDSVRDNARQLSLALFTDCSLAVREYYQSTNHLSAESWSSNDLISPDTNQLPTFEANSCQLLSP
ncbi:hypothetical protein VCRA2113O215_10363 [Vibrio crassostreae]|nr:hypothetical protein VCRA2110O175_10351 [Vibrio crassostreae]CAK1874427.1 hypothetical protein VCRA2113O231_10363 [Vibrio crassostreae]CAK1875191.1 hypothetical protein VCRA2112O191_10363 [Vibrio crassostreae]CAK2008411.1 hypothetical protein VCRA2113O197_20342 [Vibrio crassostreae]CAK2014364.1 hypothetical protein VCRA2112O184_20364 [Vibrio crassostreae]